MNGPTLHITPARVAYRVGWRQRVKILFTGWVVRDWAIEVKP